MPVGTPPLGGPLGKSRSRLSASGLTTFLRCKRQWFLGSKVGLSGPLRPSQVFGIVVEDALCEVMMHHAPNVSSQEELRQWADSLVAKAAQEAFSKGEELWSLDVWHDGDWADVEVESLESRISSGLDLFFEEIQACYDANGGPFLEEFRAGNSVFDVQSPTWGSEPQFPIARKVHSIEMRSWSDGTSPVWSSGPVTWNEAWEIARPWFKDPRVHQPQRLFHPDGWAAGELDIVLRWDERIRIVDIKSGDPNSRFAESLQHQLRFYAWLWNKTHDGQFVDGLEGWYLDGAQRVCYDAPDSDSIANMDVEFKDVHSQMLAMGEGPAQLPGSIEHACEGDAAGCHWCSLAIDEGVLVNTELLDSIWDGSEVKLTAPSEKLSMIPSRVNVKGKFTGAWGPLPNHFSEPVLGAMLTTGSTQVTIEESEAGSFPNLHDSPSDDVIILNALPGVWRGSPRLYVDSKSQIISADDWAGEDELTRLGMLRVKANVEGILLSSRKRSGARLDGKPWMMLSMHLWDGEHVAELVAFGSSITRQLEEANAGDHIKVVAAELGWRAGLPQLRIDTRSTRVTIKK